MADTQRPTPTFETPPVVDQIDSLLRRDLEVIDLSDERIVVDLADSANDRLAIIDAEPAPEVDEEPERPLDVDLSDPAVVDSLDQLASQLDNPQLVRLISLVRRQADWAS